jgi:TatD DNase family protein
MELVDIGSNLTHESFRDDLDDVLQRASDAGVHRIVVTGADEKGSRDALELARRYPARLRATAGVHPHVARNAGSDVIDNLRLLAEQELVVAVGEAGLDFNRDFSPRDIQRELFERQLQLAIELGMPVFAHERDAHGAFVEIVEPLRDRLGPLVVHCFTGTCEELDAYLALDCHIGITGWICDERRGQHMHDFLARIPPDRLMIETDAPYLLPRDLQPKPKSRRNEPANLPHILETLARIRGEAPERLAETTTATARRFFGF